MARRKSPPVVLALSALACVVCALACGCATDAGKPREEAHPSPMPSNPTSVTGIDWVLTRLGDRPAMPAEVAARPWLRLDPSDKRRVTGNTGVNLLTGAYELSGGALAFGPMITTKRAGEPALMQQESDFLNALQRTATADLSGRTLTLRDASHAPLAEFEAKDVKR